MAEPFSFGRDRRVRRRADFVRIQAGGVRVTTPHFVFLLSSSLAEAHLAETHLAETHTASRPPSRLGLVVSKKVGNSVERSRVKRLCRECFRLHPTWVPTGVDVVVIAKSGAPKLSYAEVEAEWLAVERLVQKKASGLLAAPARDGHPSAGTSPARGVRPRVSPARPSKPRS